MHGDMSSLDWQFLLHASDFDVQGSQNDSHFEISSHCVVSGSRFHREKSAANDNQVGVNLKMGVILRDLLMSYMPRVYYVLNIDATMMFELGSKQIKRHDDVQQGDCIFCLRRLDVCRATQFHGDL